MTGVYVAVGSNVHAAANARIALAGLKNTFPGLHASPAYQNAAVGFAGDDFINLVVGFETDRSLRQVIDELHRIEGLCGRARDAPKWAPRSMDLDILLFGDLVGEFAGVTLPRPDLTRRPYMLGPMADIAPDLLHPTERRTMAQLWQAFDRHGHEMGRIEL